MNTLALFNKDSLTKQQIKITKGWFFLSVFALIASGIFSLLLVLSRAPVVSDFIPWIDFFHTALVVHVDLSVLIWFLSFTAIFWSLNNLKASPTIDRFCLYLSFIGTALIVITPFIGQAHPIINNYIPVLNDSVFFYGLIFIGLSFTVLSVRSLLVNSYTSITNLNSSLKYAITFSVITIAIAIVAFCLSYFNIGNINIDHAYFEYLFWGGGHILQFSHTLLLLVAWIVLSHHYDINYSLNPKIYVALFALCFSPVFLTPFIYSDFPVNSAEHRHAFTQLMRWGGLTALPLGLLISLNIFKSFKQSEEYQRPIKIAFISSVVLFATGGILGFLIDGINVVIPAHYHGSIVGVTLAFMGITFVLLPILGYQKPIGKLARLQPIIYSTGQMMHIIGLAWSGGYGVKRKTAGAAQGLDSIGQVAGMGLMGLGGLVAIIGGVMFLIIIYKSITFKFNK